MHEILQALRIRPFRRLAVTYTVNDLAHFLATIALSVLVYDATGDVLATTALFLAAEFLPALAVPALAARVEGGPPARLLASVYVSEALLLVLLSFVSESFWLGAVLVLAFLNGSLAALGRAVTRATSVRILEPAGQLRAGNAALNVGFAITSAGGPVLAGALVATLGTAPVLDVAAALFAGLAVAVIGADLPGSLPLAEDDEEAGTWRARLTDGLDYVRTNRVLRGLLFGQAFVLVLLTMATPIQVVYAKETLDAGDFGFGVLIAAWGVGMLLGSALFARESGRSIRALVLVSTAAMGLGYLGVAAAPTLLAACLATLLGGVGNGVQWVSVVTAIQEATEERFQARVAGFFEACVTAAPGFGFVLGGAITALLSPRAAFAVSGAGVLLVLPFGAWILSRRPAVVADEGEEEPVLEPALEPA